MQGSTSLNVPINTVAFVHTGRWTILAMSGFESLKDVALRPWPEKEKDELSRDALLQQIEQLAAERGHLRGVTEQSLLADIDAGKDVPEDAKEGLESKDEEKRQPTVKQKQEEIIKMQMEMAGHLEYAHPQLVRTDNDH